MKALVLWADDRSANMGVRALARGAASLIRSCDSSATVEFQSFGAGASPIPFSNRSILRAAAPAPRSEMGAWLRSYDVVLDTRAGDSFADIYGVKRHAVMSAASYAASKNAVPIIMMPQTLGPFLTRAGRQIARQSVAQSRLVLARDSVSAEYAREAFRRPVELATDVVFAIDQPSRGPVRDVLFNVSGLLWNANPHVDSAGYRRIVRSTIDLLRTSGRDVTLLAHVVGSSGPDNDVPAVEEVAALLGGDVDLLLPADLDETRSAIAGARLVVGSRMHACLNALSVGVPAIPLSYSRKFAPLLADLGWPHTVDLSSADFAPERVVAAAQAADLGSLAEKVGVVARSRIQTAVAAISKVL